MNLHAWLAGLFSLLIPGLGQVYAGYPKRGATFFLASCAVDAAFLTGLLGRTFITAVVVLAVNLLLRIVATIDAARLGRRRPEVTATYQRWWAVLLAGATVVLLWGALSTTVQVLESYEIPTGAMAPALIPGDIIIAAHDAFDDRAPRTGDIVVFRSPDASQLQVKRVAAVAGDRIDFLDLQSPPTITSGSTPGSAGSTSRLGLTVPEDAVYVLGDNYANSRDSRSYGPIPLDQVVGAPLYILWSDDRDRIGQSLRQE